MIHSRNEPMPVEMVAPMASQRSGSSGALRVCPSCGGGPVQTKTVSSVFWRGEEALMVRGVPAMICTTCGEDFVSDATARALNRIRETGFGGVASDLQINLPVFDFGTFAADGTI